MKFNPVNLLKPIWLSLDEHDNELPMFVHALATSLQTVFPDACRNTASLLKARQFPLPDQVVTLIIDDIADLPEDITLVLATRTDPPLSLSRWRARGYLYDLRSTDLRFTLAETEAFLTRV